MIPCASFAFMFIALSLITVVAACIVCFIRQRAPSLISPLETHVTLENRIVFKETRRKNSSNKHYLCSIIQSTDNLQITSPSTKFSTYSTDYATSSIIDSHPSTIRLKTA